MRDYERQKYLHKVTLVATTNKCNVELYTSYYSCSISFHASIVAAALEISAVAALPLSCASIFAIYRRCLLAAIVPLRYFSRTKTFGAPMKGASSELGL